MVETMRIMESVQRKCFPLHPSANQPRYAKHARYYVKHVDFSLWNRNLTEKEFFLFFSPHFFPFQLCIEYHMHIDSQPFVATFFCCFISISISISKWSKAKQSKNKKCGVSRNSHTMQCETRAKIWIATILPLLRSAYTIFNTIDAIFYAVFRVCAQFSWQICAIWILWLLAQLSLLVLLSFWISIFFSLLLL